MTTTPEQIDELAPDPENASQHRINEAFEKSEAVTFQGELLHVLDNRRVAAMYAMGVRYGRWVDEDYQKLAEMGTYDNVTNDIMVVLWLCSVDNRTVMKVLAGGNQLIKKDDGEGFDSVPAREWALAKAYEFAESKGVTYASAGFKEAADVFAAQTRYIQDSATELGEKEGEKPKASTSTTKGTESPN